MQEPVQITFKNLDPAPAIAREIEKRTEQLEKLFPRIVRCHVTVEAPHRHRRHGRTWKVSVVPHMPGQDIVIGEHVGRNPAHRDVMVALHDAFDAVKRRLQDAARTMRGQVKRHEAPLAGRIVRLLPEEDHGFLEGPEGEVYFHRNSLIAGEFDSLSPGDEVRFEIAEAESPHGYQATTVRPVGKHHIVG